MPADPSAPALPEPPPPAAALLAEAARIADPELRERFLAAAARYLGRFKPPHREG